MAVLGRFAAVSALVLSSVSAAPSAPTLPRDAAGAAAWTTADQAAVANVAGVAVSPSAEFVVVETSTLEVHHANGTKSAGGAAVSAFCAGAACAQAAFSSKSSLAFVSNSSLWVSHLVGASWSAPKMVDTSGKPPLAFVWHPGGAEIAYSAAVLQPHSKTEPRVLVDDVIIDVIMGTPTVTRNELCFAPVPAADGSSSSSSSAAAAPRCDSALKGSVGMAGWTISCWPQDSQFAYAPGASGLMAVTTTNTTKANDWVSLSVHLLDTATSKAVPVATATAFQPSFSPDGKQLAYTIADEGDYVWAQTWHICVVDVAKAMAGQGSQNTKCDTHGTFDQMPTIVGWDASGSSVLYMEQNGTAVELYAMAVDSLSHSGSASGAEAGAGWRPVGPLGHATAAEGGVIGGGFRATSRVSVAHTAAGATMVGYTWESFHSPQQGFVSVLSESLRSREFRQEQQHAQASTVQLTHLSADAVAHSFPAVEIVQWPSDDGLSVEGLLIKPAGWSAGKTYPLITFTHCGPAMAVLQTFIGYGSVCARFPLEIWAERGYMILMPNYRGSTGYGAKFRRGDRHDWGGGDYNDVFSGVSHFVATKQADPKHLAHVGWSYG